MKSTKLIEKTIKTAIRLSLTVAIFLSCMFIGTTTIAYAGSAQGSTVSGTATSGKVYYSYNKITASAGVAAAQAVIYSSTTSPSGYLGASASLYQGSTLITNAPMQYSASSYAANSLFIMFALKGGGASGSYFCAGYSNGYNSSTGAYLALYPPNSPNQTAI